MRPGMIARLKAGEKMQGFAPAGNSSFEPVALRALQGIAAGVGLTYDQATGDLTQANYSSLRAGKIEFRRLTADLQWNTLEPQVLTRITDRWWNGDSGRRSAAPGPWLAPPLCHARA